MFTINKNVQNKVYEMFGKTEQTANEDVKKIEEWMENQPHLPEIMDHIKIRNFLNLSKYNLEKTKERIDAYYTTRSNYPQVINDCNPELPHMKQTMEDMYICSHPQLIDALHRFTLFKMKRKDTFNPQNLIKSFFNVFEIRLQNDVITDDVICVDFDNITFNDLIKVTPLLLYRGILVYKKVFAFRLKAAYFINSPSYITIMLKILKLLLKPKLYERIKVYQDTECLKEIFSVEDLPEDYGGNGPSLNELNEMMKAEFSKNQGRFDQLDTFKVNDDLRPK